MRARQDDGVIETDWLVEYLGISRAAISRAVVDGLLHGVHRGLVSPDASLSDRGRMRAATLAVPPGVLGGLSAAALHGLLPLRGEVELLAPTYRPGPRGVRVRRATLDPQDVTTRHRMRVLTVPRLLLDCARLPIIDHLIHEAEVERILDLAAIDDVLTRHAGQRGVAQLRQALLRRDPSKGRTKSALERKGRRFLAKHGFPPHERGVVLDLDGYKIESDCWWEQHRLALEWDGRSVHETARALEKDKLDDSLLLAQGIVSVRATWARLERDEDGLAATLWAIIRR